MEKDLVVIESPYKGDDYKELDRNIEYAKSAIIDCLINGEIPFASHLLYTQVLDDKKHLEREIGIEANLGMINKADKIVVYEDYGISIGMQKAIDYAKEIGKVIEYREMPEFNVKYELD